MANLTYLTASRPKEPVAYQPVKNTVGAYKPGTYKSKYGTQIDNAFNTVTNWKYDPLQDASYQALAKVYGARGNIAAKNTLADAAALNGGLQTSYAVSAAQQARNQYNQELAAYVPQLEQAAYGRATDLLANLRQADDTDYGRWRDSEGDRQWTYTNAYNQYRDQVADAQWLYGQNYQKYRDLMSDYEWATNYNMDVRQQLLAEAARAGSGGGGGGGRRRSGGGGSYGGSNSSYGYLYDDQGNGGGSDSDLPKESIYKKVSDTTSNVLGSLTRKKSGGGSAGDTSFHTVNKVTPIKKQTK